MTAEMSRPTISYGSHASVHAGCDERGGIQTKVLDEMPASLDRSSHLHRRVPCRKKHPPRAAEYRHRFLSALVTDDELVRIDANPVVARERKRRGGRPVPPKVSHHRALFDPERTIVMDGLGESKRLRRERILRDGRSQIQTHLLSRDALSRRQGVDRDEFHACSSGSGDAASSASGRKMRAADA